MMKPRLPSSQTSRSLFFSRPQSDKKTQCQSRESPFSSTCQRRRHAFSTTVLCRNGDKSTARERMRFHLDLSGWSNLKHDGDRGRKTMVVKVRVYEQRRHTSSQSQTQPPSGEKTTETKEPAQSQSPAGEKPTPAKPQSPSSSTLSTDPTTRQLSHVTTLSSDPSPSQSPPSTQQSRLYHTITALAHTSRSRLRRVADKYDNAQSRRPYFTQFLCTLVIYFFGDVCAQMVALSGEDKEEEEDKKGEEGEKKGYDPIRTIRHLCVGGILAVPNWKWFMFLHHHFNYPSITLSILTKVTISQIIYTPIFNTYFFSAQSLLAGNNIADTIERVVAAVPVSVVNSLMVWPAVTGLTFLYVQPQYRSLFSGVVAIGWQTYLSWLNSKAAREVRMERVEEDEREKGKGTEKDLSEQKHIAVVATAAAS